MLVLIKISKLLWSDHTGYGKGSVHIIQTMPQKYPGISLCFDHSVQDWIGPEKTLRTLGFCRHSVDELQFSHLCSTQVGLSRDGLGRASHHGATTLSTRNFLKK